MPVCLSIQGKSSRIISVGRGVRQGDALSATLFNLTLESAVRKVGLSGSIIYKLKQAHAYADDIVLIARNMTALTEMFQIIENEGRRLGLRINESKTKYMKMATTALHEPRARNLNIGGYVFENVENFSYLGSELNTENKISQEINRRIMLGNRAYHANFKMLKSKLLSHKTKTTIYKTLIRPVVTYGCEAWTLTVKDMNALKIFERKMIRRIYGPVREGDVWRIRSNSEINAILQSKDVVRFIKARRIGWLGHVSRMSPDRIQRQLLDGRMFGSRRRGRPRRRWLQEVTDDLSRMGIGNWRSLVGERPNWRRIVEDAKAHPGL